jgi:hypothetical protein
MLQISETYVCHVMSTETRTSLTCPLLGYGAVSSNGTMEYVTEGKVFDASTAGNGVLYAVRGESDVTKQWKKCWKLCFLLASF